MAEYDDIRAAAKADQGERAVAMYRDEVRAQSPTDDAVGWLDNSQDRMAITLDRLESVLAPVLGDLRPSPQTDDVRGRSGTSPIVNRISTLASREDDLVERLTGIISRIEV